MRTTNKCETNEEIEFQEFPGDLALSLWWSGFNLCWGSYVPSSHMAWPKKKSFNKEIESQQINKRYKEEPNGNFRNEKYSS